MRSISVVIPTRNRCESAINVLESIEAADLDGTDLEVIVVASNCTDDTVHRCNAYFKHLRFRACVNDVQLPGVARAKNNGIETASGELILFIDDDMTISEGFFQKYIEGIDRFPEAAIYGGRIVSRWPHGKPWWYPAADRRRVDGVIGNFDPLQADGYMVQVPFGGNMGMKASALKGRSFDERMGMRGGCLGFGEESDMVKVLQREGYKVAYLRDAVTYHHMQPYFCSLPYVVRRLYMLNVTLIRLGYFANVDIPKTRTKRYVNTLVKLMRAMGRSMKERDTDAIFTFLESVARRNTVYRNQRHSEVSGPKHGREV